MTAARYLGTGAVKPPSEHPSVGEGEQTKLPSSNRGCLWEQGLRPGEAVACVAACPVALVEQPDPAAVPLAPLRWLGHAGSCVG